MKIPTVHRTARLRPAAAVVVLVPLLALSAACGRADGAREDGSGAIASVPDEPAAQRPSGTQDRAGDGGDKGSTTAGKSAYYDAQLEYVRCMRTKAGVKDFPDPRLSGYLDWSKINEIRDPNGDGSDTKGGRNGVCAEKMLAADELSPPRDKQKDYESMLAHATCMRDNGVSAFANPTLSGGGVMPGGEPDPMNPRIDERTPSYQRARTACESKLLEGLDGMQ
ncbi:hypothetical protein [Streptomyces clavuligerus]|nr:hypothetical protein [Streptomyces clavuligerus]ANW21412.1 hypothetical protein BB341_25975 [Streptomyces clavuligerus]AXU16044.1 hypothetical protein D1794_26990 [Streptomyces clavuligerus]MBY6306179.1 hypothetical protein [Streptomyces clavuligerus]QCS08822.1 hypothetical protein CRV15_26355 [Streptomyces clavuligerus]QPJ91839.1 hypothetical protein GE265_01780 [Streptomyces clavuligerus]